MSNLNTMYNETLFPLILAKLIGGGKSAILREFQNSFWSSRTLSSIVIIDNVFIFQRMSEVSLSLGGKVKSVLVYASESVVSFECKMKQLFGIDSNTDIYGIRNEATGKTYSVEEVFSNPSLLSETTGSIIPVGRSMTL